MGHKIFEEHLDFLETQGVLTYEALGESDFSDINYVIHLNIYDNLIHALENMKDRVNQTELTIKEREQRVFGFSSDDIGAELNQAMEQLATIENNIVDANLLQALQPKVKEIKASIDSLRRVTNVYDDIHRNVIVPLKEESEKGVRVTTRWAILSILITLLITLVIENVL